MKNNTYKELVDENIEKYKGKGLSESYSNQLQKNEITNPIEKTNIIKKCRIEIFKKNINNIFIGLHIFAFILYVISLKQCKGGQEELKKYNELSLKMENEKRYKRISRYYQKTNS